VRKRTLFYAMPGVRRDVCEDRFFWKPQTTFWSLWFSSFQVQARLDCINHYEWRGEFDETNPKAREDTHFGRCPLLLAGLRSIFTCFSMVISDVVGELGWQPRASVSPSWQRNQRLELRRDNRLRRGCGIWCRSRFILLNLASLLGTCLRADA
jgi:hypothetical protein